MPSYCWSYPATGALECSYIKVNAVNPTTVDLSERQLMSCTGGGTCGGWPFKIFEWLKSSGAKVMNDDIFVRPY